MTTKVYVGSLHERVTVSDLEKEFEYFGKISDVWVAKNPPGFAFIHFENRDDADDAIKDMDGRTFKGTKIRVELSSGGRGGAGGGRSRIASMDCYNCGELGHLSRDCRNRGSGGRRRSRSRSRSPPRRRRSYSRSRSRSPRFSVSPVRGDLIGDTPGVKKAREERSRSRQRRSRSRSPRRSRSRSPVKRSRSASPRRSRSPKAKD